MLPNVPDSGRIPNTKSFFHLFKRVFLYHPSLLNFLTALSSFLYGYGVIHEIVWMKYTHNIQCRLKLSFINNSKHHFTPFPARTERANALIFSCPYSLPPSAQLAIFSSA